METAAEQSEGDSRVVTASVHEVGHAEGEPGADGGGEVEEETGNGDIPAGEEEGAEGDAEMGDGEEVERPAGDGSRIARAQSAWMLFLAANRQQVREEHPGLPIGQQQKILSERWKSLSEEERGRFHKLAAEDKARMQRDLKAAGLSRLPSARDLDKAKELHPAETTAIVLPLSRVKKTIRLDPGVGNISREGLNVVAKAAELFLAQAAQRSWAIGRQAGRKSVRPTDLADYVFSAPEMYWLKGEFKGERSGVSKGPGPGPKKAPKLSSQPPPKGTKSITTFFAKA